MNSRGYFLTLATVMQQRLFYTSYSQEFSAHCTCQQRDPARAPAPSTTFPPCSIHLELLYSFMKACFNKQDILYCTVYMNSSLR